ncbi:MAG: hypothetical protein V1735_07530 [Nanoarchaeota archaeon]
MAMKRKMPLGIKVAELRKQSNQTIRNRTHQPSRNAENTQQKRNEMKQIPIKEFAPYWKKCREVTEEYSDRILKLEAQMRKELGNDQLMFFWCDDGIVGIGTEDRKMPLIHDTELNELLQDS